MRTAGAAALALVLLANPGCGNTNGPPNPCTGTYDAAVSGTGGAPNTSFSGCSFYRADGSFSLSLGYESGHRIGISFNGARPGTGSHQIGAWSPNPSSSFGTFTLSGNNLRFFFSLSGTLTLTESTAGKVKGSFTMNMYESATNPQITATVAGNFDATCGIQGVTC